MIHANQKAPSVCGAQGFGYQTHSEIVQPFAAASKKFHSDPAAGKSLAMWLYNHGVSDLEDTNIAFNRRPHWRAA